MARRFSWCTVVALVVLLFVTTEGLRERNTQIDDNKPTSRGALRFTSKSQDEATTVPSLLLSRSKAPRGRLTPSKRSSSVDKQTEGTTLSPASNSELNFDPPKSSIAKATRTNERARLSATTEATNNSKRNPLSRNAGVTKRPESGVNRRSGKRYSPDSDEPAILKNNEQKTSVDGTKGLSRKASSGRTSQSSATERLDNRGPSVFLATTESSRSRTGRKIQTTYSMKDLKTQIPTSRRYVNKKFGDAEATTVSVRRDGRGRSTTEKTERNTRSGRSKANNRENASTTRRGPDTVLSESESVRVDIPLTVDGTESPIPEVTTGFGTVSQRRSDVKDTSRSSGRNGSERSKGRGRSNDSEAGSRRGSSRFNDFTTTEPTEQFVRNTVPRDRSRGSDAKKSSANDSRSRSRSRNFENSVKANSASGLERDAKRKSIGERGSSDRRSRVIDATSRPIDSRGQDTQDMRVRTRNRPRSEVSTLATTDVTTTITPDTTVLNDVTTITPDLTGTTTLRPVTTVPTTMSPRTTTRPSTTTSTTEAPGRARGRARGGSQGRKSKEDFFNHGLGFRGRKFSPEGSSNATESRRTNLSRNDPQSHGNPGWTLRRRPGHLNYPESASRTVGPSPTDQTNEVIPPNEQSTSTEVVTTTETVTSSTRRGSKKLQTTDESTTVAGTTTKGYRRGNKMFGPSTTTTDHEDSDNYPPEFKAKLNQLKNTDTKIPAPKTTPRSPLEDQQEGNYGRRLRNNLKAFEPDDLDTAASGYVFTDESLVVNPFTLIDGTGLRRVKRSSAALFAERSRMKLDLARRLVKPELNIEENDLDATTASSFSKTKPAGVTVAEETTSKPVGKFSKATATTAARRTLTSIESSREEASAKASKRSSSRKALEDSSSKVTARPYSIKKGRIIAERMVTSISIEEGVTPEETTKPYAMDADASVMTTSTEEASATTIDSTKIRPAGNHKGKKSKEQDSKLPLNSKRRMENIDTVTIRPQKKSYSYQPRINKSQEQLATIDHAPTTIPPKKSNAFSQRKSVTSQEEGGAKKSIFGSGATKPTFRPRYSKRNKQKLVDDKTQQQPTVTTQQPIATSRYSRKKSAVKSTEDKPSQPGITEEIANQARKLEFRPRTATYRRHSEVPTTLVQSTAKTDAAGVAITPRSTKYHATLKTSTPTARSVEQEPQVNIRIANETTQGTAGIIGSSNGDNRNSNIFSPTRSAAILSGNNTLLEQVRSTVAPLLSSLGNRTPVFSGSYSNVNNANSPPRITPSGQPPRFSARYKGAELFIRKQNNIYQPTVPSITSSSTTAVTPVETSGQAPMVDVVSPGEPRLLTLYQALESISVRNEQLEGNTSAQQREQAGVAPQDTTSATAQGTAGSGIGQTTETGSSTIPTTIATTPSPPPESPSSESPPTSPITTTSSPVETSTPTTTTETATATSVGRVPQTTGMDVVTVTPVTETTTVSVDTGENLASTEAGPTTAPPETMTTTSGSMSTNQAANDSTTVAPESTTAPGNNETASTTMPTQTTPGTTMLPATTPPATMPPTTMPPATMPPATMPSATPTSRTPTTPYLGRFGGSRLTPAPRFSLSSTTRAPLRDYLVYGIYPNKTIVRKRPEDNLIDARNVDSPYVIFGIFPDGRLVRKFPNGTIIPDPPRNPVEVVFSLSTSTTTNRPPPRPYYNQANQGTYNQYRGATFDYNGRPVADPMRNVQSPGTVDLGLTGNAIVGPSGGGPDYTGPLGTPASVPSTNEMSNALLNTQMGTASIVSTGRLATDSQGGRIVQDRERDEATRTRQAGGQRSSVYIGQDKFVNYWTDGATTANPRALSVRINSVAAARNVGPSVSVPSFDNLLNNQPGGRVTAPPGFPWRDPLDQIFGITTSSPIITASVASNTLDDSSDINGPTMARPINPFVEVFTPFSSAIGVPRGSIGTIPPPPPPTSTESTTTTTTTMMPSTTTTMAPTTTTTTTTMAPTTTTTTTTMAPTTTTTTTTMAPTTTTTTTTMAPTTTTTTTTMAPTTTTTTTTMAPTTTTTTMAPTTTTTTTMPPPTTTLAPVATGQRANLESQTADTSTPAAPPIQTTQFTLPPNLLNAQQQQNAFGTTFDDLAFLNSLLQSNSRGTTQKTLTQVEQLLANKILSLALKSPGSTRSPKAINIENVSPNSIYGSSKSPSEPIVIDLSPSSTVSAPTWKPIIAQKLTTERSISSSVPQVTQKPGTSSTTTLISTTKGPIKVTPKPVTNARPKTTTQQPLGFAGLLWQTLLGGGNLFGPSTTAKPLKSKPVKTSPKLVDITPKPILTTLKTTQKLKTTTAIPSTTTARVVDVSKVRVNTPNAIAGAEKSATTPLSVSTTKQPLLNNPNPRVPNVVTSTYSPEEDAKFLVELLRAVDQDNKPGGSKKLSQVDESFLRAILSGQATAKTTPSPTSEINNAALLAALLKAQGIEPPTPSTNIREQLQLASLGQSVTSAPAGGSTTITTRPTSTATRATDSAKRTVTPRPTSGPKVRTTSWSPSSTYPPPLFSSFPGVPKQASGDDSRNGALFGATKAFSQFLGAALSGAAQQLQSLVRNGTRIVSEVVG
ncbi:uncharacterized protein LOC143423111 isoform X1 [Xylocopa sonorina]|uniref:uncharacterized protein LOC143423111 isoform X1 n=1 Tax=Xylocopa sonorina TaxID=1818115 RepID=UPI00403A8522